MNTACNRADNYFSGKSGFENFFHFLKQKIRFDVYSSNNPRFIIKHV